MRITRRYDPFNSLCRQPKLPRRDVGAAAAMAKRPAITQECKQLALHVGANLRRLRLAKGMTQADVAECIAISIEAFSRIERGLSLPSYPTLLRLGALYAVSPGALLSAAVSPSGRNGPRVRTRIEPPSGGGGAGSQSDFDAEKFVDLIDAARSLNRDDLAQLLALATSLVDANTQS